MRLLNSKNQELKEFFDLQIPPYAILSHTWRKEEVLFQDMQHSEVENKAGYSKILSCCKQAELDGYEWVWIDTCCIDKTSSAELSEAINSMYAWYKNSEVCYAFLDDVYPPDSRWSEGSFNGARWFTRGWCLQELIAPSKIEFYAKDWTEMGTRWSLHGKIKNITGIPAEVLLKKSDLTSYTIAQKMSWASERLTTREEDKAYCLLGIFGISMPLLYGEGERAFHRLQQEILRQTEDYSLLLWTTNIDIVLAEVEEVSGVFQSSPKSFPKQGPTLFTGQHCDYQSIRSIFLHEDAAPEALLAQASTPWNPPQITTRGLRIHTFVRKETPAEDSSSLLLWTGCMYRKSYMCILVLPINTSGFITYGRVAHSSISLIDAKDFSSFELSELYLSTNVRDRNFLRRNSEVGDLEIVLSTRCDAFLAFEQTRPFIGSCDNGLHYLSITRGTMVLKFISYRPTSADAPARFTGILGLYKGSPWCNIVEDLETSASLSDPQGNPERSACRGLYNADQKMPFSDRAFCQLHNGTMVRAAVKTSHGSMKGSATSPPRSIFFLTLFPEARYHTYWC